MNTITKIVPLGAPDTLLLHDIKTKFVELNKYNYVDFVVYLSKSTTGSKDAVIKLLAKRDEEGAENPIPFRQKMPNGVDFIYILDGVKPIKLDLLESTMLVFRVTSESLMKGGFDRVAIEIPGITLSDVRCSIVGILYSPRYTE